MQALPDWRELGSEQGFSTLLLACNQAVSFVLGGEVEAEVELRIGGRTCPQTCAAQGMGGTEAESTE